jgi:hypothetical protein
MLSILPSVARSSTSSIPASPYRRPDGFVKSERAQLVPEWIGRKYSGLERRDCEHGAGGFEIGTKKRRTKSE